MVITDSRHRRTCRNNIAEVVQQIEDLLCTHRVLVLLLNAGYLVGNAPMHLLGRLLIDVAKRVLHGIFVHPHSSCQFVTAKIG